MNLKGRRQSTNVDDRRSSGKKVAIVGGGPAGLSAAYQLAVKGHAVTVMDMADLPTEDAIAKIKALPGVIRVRTFA